MIGCFNKPDHKALRYRVQKLPRAFSAKAKDGHLFLHLVETIWMVIVLDMRQEEHAVQLLITKRDPLRPSNVAFMR